jgi:hypothetical protein
MSFQLRIPAADQIVQEYLIYRGFTQSYKNFEIEKNKDKAKLFDISKLTDSIFQSLQNFEIEEFLSLWDFLSRRFFLHLDSDYINYSSLLKSDLLKFYLVTAKRASRKDKISDLFSAFSHEFLAESGSTIEGNLRAWFVLPYIEEPEKDPEFAGEST